MNGVLVIAEARDRRLRPVTFELIGAALALSEQGAGPVQVLLTDRRPDELAPAVSIAGVSRVLLAESPCERFEAHVAQSAAAAAILRHSPAIVLAGHTIDSLGFTAALAASGGHGFAADATELSFSGEGLLAVRETHGGRLVAELEFPGARTVIALLRPGTFQPATPTPSDPELERLDADLSARARTEHVESTQATASEVDIAAAPFLLSIGRGIGEAENVTRFEQLAQRLGATLAASRPLVDAGWVEPARQVGQSGRTVSPTVYLAMGISGAVQHLAGMSQSGTIIAVNSDRAAPIFASAHYGAVADMFEIADAMEQQLR